MVLLFPEIYRLTDAGRLRRCFKVRTNRVKRRMASSGDVQEGYAQLYITTLTLKEKEGATGKDVDIVFRIFIRQEEDFGSFPNLEG